VARAAQEHAVRMLLAQNRLRRTLGRFLLAAATSLSLLVCMAGIAAWAGSYWACETLGWYANRWHGQHCDVQGYGLSSDSGGLLIFCLRRDAHIRPGDDEGEWFKRDNPDLYGFNHFSHEPAGYPYMTDYAGQGRAGFGHFFGSPQSPNPLMTYDDHFVVFPAWLIVVVAAVLPARWLATSVRRRRASRLGLCLRCGYDLRASGGRCPECGEHQKA
jgi:hypothetical protein